MTGFQAIAGGVARPYEAPFEGKIVAWSITLAKPSTVESRPPPTRSASSTNSSAHRRRPGSASCARSKARSRPVHPCPPEPARGPQPLLRHHPDLRPRAPADRLKGQVVALTVPTWAPMFAFNVDDDNTWRGSRLPEHCASKEDIQGGHPQQGVGKTKTYGCYYRTRGCFTRPLWSRNRRASGVGSGTPPLSPDWRDRLEPSEIASRPAAQNVRRGTRPHLTRSRGGFVTREARRGKDPRKLKRETLGWLLPPSALGHPPFLS